MGKHVIYKRRRDWFQTKAFNLGLVAVRIKADHYFEQGFGRTNPAEVLEENQVFEGALVELSNSATTNCLDHDRSSFRGINITDGCELAQPGHSQHPQIT